MKGSIWLEYSLSGIRLIPVADNDEDCQLDRADGIDPGGEMTGDTWAITSVRLSKDSW